MSFQISGKLHKVFDTEHKTETFQAREFVLLINEQSYAQYIRFQLTQDRCDLIDGYNEGDELEVHFDLRGREWNGKYFTNLNAWKLLQPSVTARPTATADFPENAPPQADQEENRLEDFELPF
jgi:single-strand DNA-binding protein